MDVEGLKKKISDIEELEKAGIISKEKAQEWKNNIIMEFEQNEVPERRLPNDFAHFPGRLVGSVIKGMSKIGKNVAEGVNRMENLESGRNNQGDQINIPKRRKNVVELYEDLERKL